VSTKIGLTSIDTGNEQRDAHLRSAEFDKGPRFR
jgi:polyisoprenoid-binding protein YceI